VPPCCAAAVGKFIAVMLKVRRAIIPDVTNMDAILQPFLFVLLCSIPNRRKM
jgi:hypothetical protein